MLLKFLLEYTNPSLNRGSKLAEFSNSLFLLFSKQRVWNPLLVLKTLGSKLTYPKIPTLKIREFGGISVQGATFRIKAPIKTSLSLIANFQVIKTAHEGIVQTLIDKVNPKSFLHNLNLASFEVIQSSQSGIS